MAFDDVREFVDVLDRHGELVRVQRRIELQYEVGQALRQAYARGGPAVVFEDNGTKFPLVAGLYSTRRHAALAFQTTEAGLHDKVLAGLQAPLPPEHVQGPAAVHEVEVSGDEVDLSAFPIPWYSPDDGGPFITPGILVSRDPETGVTDLGHYRFQVMGRSSLSFLAQPFHRFGKHIAKARRAGQSRYEAAIVVGADPVLAYACQVQTSDLTEDYAVAGGLRGEPVELVRARTVDVDVPARAEVVFELDIHLDEEVEEGPLGEYTGYYTPAALKPLAVVQKVTYRRGALFQGLLTGKPVTENHILKQVPFEASLFRTLHAQFPTLTKVAVLASAGVSFIIVLAMAPRYAGEARQAIMAAMASNVRPKFVVAVDPDIDVHDSGDVQWAAAFRVRPAEDVFTIDHLPAGPLDPSVDEEIPLGQRTNAAVGIDATLVPGRPFPKVADVPGWQELSFPELDTHNPR